eukprot:COSAG02_NODE_3127_length_7316_cov_6.965360_2_plen_89_part_00
MIVCTYDVCRVVPNFSCRAAPRPVQPLPSELPPLVEARVTLSYIPRLVDTGFQQTKALGWPSKGAREDAVSRSSRRYPAAACRVPPLL